MKNITVRGFSTFIKTLRKHILAGTYMNFWKEVHSKSRALVHANYTLAGTSYKIIYMNELINKMIELMPDISEQEMLDVISKVVRISFLFESKYWFMLSVKEAELIKPLEDGVDKASVADDTTIEAIQATLVPSPEDSPVEQATDTLNDIMIDVDQEVIKSVTSRVEELMKLSIKELRAILKDRDVKYAPAHKEAKLIELVIASDNS